MFSIRLAQSLCKFSGIRRSHNSRERLGRLRKLRDTDKVSFFRGFWLVGKSRNLFFLGPAGISFAYFCGFGVPFMKKEAIAEGDVGPFEDLEVTGTLGLSFEIMDAKGVGGNEPVISRMPPSGMTEVCRVIEDGETRDASLERSPV